MVPAERDFVQERGQGGQAQVDFPGDDVHTASRPQRRGVCHNGEQVQVRSGTGAPEQVGTDRTRQQRCQTDTGAQVPETLHCRGDT